MTLDGLQVARWRVDGIGTAAPAPEGATDARQQETRGSKGRMHHTSTAALANLRPVLVVLALAALGSIHCLSSARALEEGADEAKAIDACDKRLCGMLQQKNPKGDDLKCALTKTWAKSTLKEADQRDVKWSFGDARCSVDINMSRAAIVAAVSGGDAKLWVPPHTANCIIEQEGQANSVTATLAPKSGFKG